MKYTYEIVKKFIESEGYQLLENSYTNVSTKMKLVCPNGHETNTMTFATFKKGSRCKQCYYDRLKVGRFTYEQLVNSSKVKPFGKRITKKDEKALKECLRLAEEHKVKSSRSVKSILGNFLKYDRMNMVERYTELLNSLNDTTSLKALVLRYGDKEGAKRYNKWQTKKQKTEKYHKDNNTEHYQEICERRSKSISKQGFIERYGKEEGLVKYNTYRFNRSKTLSKEGFINRYGEKEGIEKYLIYKSSILGGSFSMISQDLFWALHKKLPDIIQSNCYFGEKNEELCKIDIINQNVYYYDFVIENIKFVIEFNGDDIHGNPKFYKSDDLLKYFGYDKYGGMLAKDKWEIDEMKCDFLKQHNYLVLTIWEHDYKHNKQQVIDQLIGKIEQRMKEYGI